MVDKLHTIVLYMILYSVISRHYQRCILMDMVWSRCLILYFSYNIRLVFSLLEKNCQQSFRTKSISEVLYNVKRNSQDA